jgi:hypothetical protein
MHRMGVPLRDLIDPAAEARLRASIGQEPAPPPDPDAADEAKKLPGFIKEKIEKRGDGDSDKDDPKRSPHAFVGDGGLCKKCMAPKGAKVHTNTADEKAWVELEAKDGLGQMERKSDPVAGATQVLEADEATGQVRAIVSVTGVEDRVKDVIEPGAYTKSIAKQEPIGVWSHDDKTWVARADSYRELLPGDPELKGLRLQDGSPWPAHAGAVIVDARFNLETPHGAAAFSDVKFFQGKTSWSIGYRATKAHRNPRTGVRHIKELDWFEFSPVMVGANQHAMTLSVKSLAGDHSVDPDDATGLLADESLMDELTPAELLRYSELKGDLALEEKGKARIIRTAAGARRFGGNIGDVIRADGTLERRDPGSARPGMVPDGRGGMKPGMVSNDRSADGGSKPRPANQDVEDRRTAADRAGVLEVTDEARELARELGISDEDAAEQLRELREEDDDQGPSEFQRRAADGEPKVIGLANRGERVKIRKDDHPLDGKVVTIGAASGKYDVEVTDEDGKKHVIDTYVTGLPAGKGGSKPAAAAAPSGTPKAVAPASTAGSKVKASELRVGDEVDFLGMGPGGPADPVVVKGRITNVDEGSSVVTLTVGGKTHKVRKDSPIQRTKAGGSAPAGDSGGLVPGPGPGGTADLSSWKVGDRGLQEKPLPGGGRLLNVTADGGKGQTQLGVVDADGRSQGKMSMILMGEDKGKWIASSTRARLGVFDTAEEAVAAIRKADPNAKERADNAEPDRTDVQKLAAINKRRRAKGQPPLLRLPNEAKALDLAETTDDELCALEDDVEVKGSRASLNRSPRKNWVEQAGDLPGYIREVARAIEREQGLALDRAIPIAIGRIKKWARGGGDVTAETRAKAATAVAAWEALKAKAGKKYDSELLDEMEHKALAVIAALEVLEEAGVDVEVKAFDHTADLPADDGPELAPADEVLALLERGSELKAAVGLVDASDLFAAGDEFRAELPPFS